MSKPTLTNPSELKELLRRFDVDLKHSLGQNFLISRPIIDKILATSTCGQSDLVLEVGPGAGTLTTALLESGAEVVSIEKDKSLFSLLHFTTSEYSENFTLLEGDALFINAEALPFSPNKFVANLPYNIAATLILDYFIKFAGLSCVCVMVQKEVADRICAKPGTKLYGAYTVKLSLFAKVTSSFFVGRNNFMPPPRVDSAVVRLDRIPSSLTEREQLIACKVADAAFFNRRKTIYNSALAYFGKEHASDIEAWLDSCGVDSRVRGERLPVDVFETLAVNAPSFVA